MTTLRPNIATMAGYVPGFQPPDSERWIKLNTNENPYPPSPLVRQAILTELGADGEALRRYPDPASRAMRAEAARLYDFPVEWVVTANGSDELLNNLIRACVGEGEELGYVHPSYSYYATLASIQGAKVRTFGLTDDFRIKDFPPSYEGRLFFLTTPNAPLGFAFPLEYIEQLAQRCRGLLVIDEAYVDFAEFSALQLVKKYENVVVTRTFSKSYSLAGMRLGLAVARPAIVAALDKIRDHYHLDRLALVAGTAALADQFHLQASVVKIRASRERFCAGLTALGYTVIPSQANFVFVSPPDRNGKRIYDALYARKILVRYFTDPLLAHGMRITIGTDEELEATLSALKAIG